MHDLKKMRVSSFINHGELQFPFEIIFLSFFFEKELTIKNNVTCIKNIGVIKSKYVLELSGTQEV